MIKKSELETGDVAPATDPANHSMSDVGASWTSIMIRPPAIYVLLAFVCWWLFVIASGQGLRLGGPWDFSVTGALGDSFGIVSALMTSMAAIFTYQTLADTRRQARSAERNASLQRAEAAEAWNLAVAERDKSDKRNAERDEVEARRDAERTFFGLLDLRFRVLSDIKAGRVDAQQVGTDAAQYIIDRIKPNFYNQNDFSFESSYKTVYRDNYNDLGHYFRFTYHIIKFARENFGRQAYSYIRLLRAQLSNAEIVLIALNCAHGEGRGRFAEWVELYSLLHNVHPTDRKTFELDKHFRPKAFDPSAKKTSPPLGESPGDVLT